MNIARRQGPTGRTSTFAIVGLLALGIAATGCRRETGQQPAASQFRTMWGESDLTGVWKGERLGAYAGKDTFNLAKLESLYASEAREQMKHLTPKDDPTLECSPPPYPYALALGWPIQIVQSPNLLFVFNEAFHTYRTIPTDGRKHLTEEYPLPTFLGDSAGKWDKDTLVVDVVSFNGENWLAGAEDKPTPTSAGVWPTSPALHVVEQWRRVDQDTFEYQARVEDAKMLSAPWDTPTITLKRQSNQKIQEVKCLTDDPEVPPAVYLRQFGR